MSFDTADTARRSDHPVHSSFVERWSSRALTGEAIPDADLLTCFEAARWAPSGFNAQPVRFIYAHRDSDDFQKLFGLLNEKNRAWAHKAGAIVFILSRTDFAFNGQTVQVSSHAFDAGAAWSAFAHQAHLLGYATRAIGGFDRKAAQSQLNLPETYAAHVAVTIGRRAGLADLPESLHAQETPSARRPLHTFIHQGQFQGESE